MLHVVSTWCLFHSVQIQSIEIRDLERSLWIFFSIDRYQSLSAWGSTRKSMSRKGTYVYKFGVCDFVMEMFWVEWFLNRSERVKQKSKTSSSYICLFLSWSELWANYLTNLCTGVQEWKREKRRKKRKVQDLWSCRCLFYSCFLFNKGWLCEHLLKRFCDQNYIRRWQRFHTFYKNSNKTRRLAACTQAVVILRSSRGKFNRIDVLKLFCLWLHFLESIKVHMKRNQFYNTLKVQHFKDTIPKFERVWKNWRFYNTWKLCDFVLKNGLRIARPKCPDDVVFWTRLRDCNTIRRVLAITTSISSSSVEDSKKALQNRSTCCFASETFLGD